MKTPVDFPFLWPTRLWSPPRKPKSPKIDLSGVYLASVQCVMRGSFLSKRDAYSYFDHLNRILLVDIQSQGSRNIITLPEERYAVCGYCTALQYQSRPCLPFVGIYFVSMMGAQCRYAVSGSVLSICREVKVRFCAWYMRTVKGITRRIDICGHRSKQVGHQRVAAYLIHPRQGGLSDSI